MPLVQPLLSATLSTGLVSGGMLGPAAPKLASGVAAGICLWAQQQTVTTVDAGVLGVGSGQFPLLVPYPILVANLLASYASNGMIGPMSPLEATGLANGLTLGFAQGLLKTVHPTVGVGAGVGRIVGPPAFPSLMQGFSSVGITGQGASLKASAISMALVLTFQAIIFPIPIVGSPSPIPSGGVGTGKII